MFQVPTDRGRNCSPYQAVTRAQKGIVRNLLASAVLGGDSEHLKHTVRDCQSLLQYGR